jgi:hypothetical protein
MTSSAKELCDCAARRSVAVTPRKPAAGWQLGAKNHGCVREASSWPASASYWVPLWRGTHGLKGAASSSSTCRPTLRLRAIYSSELELFCCSRSARTHYRRGSHATTTPSRTVLRPRSSSDGFSVPWERPGQHSSCSGGEMDPFQPSLSDWFWQADSPGPLLPSLS